MSGRSTRNRGQISYAEDHQMDDDDDFDEEDRGPAQNKRNVRIKLKSNGRGIDDNVSRKKSSTSNIRQTNVAVENRQLSTRQSLRGKSRSEKRYDSLMQPQVSTLRRSARVSSSDRSLISSDDNRSPVKKQTRFTDTVELEVRKIDPYPSFFSFLDSFVPSSYPIADTLSLSLLLFHRLAAVLMKMVITKNITTRMQKVLTMKVMQATEGREVVEG